MTKPPSRTRSAAYSPRPGKTAKSTAASAVTQPRTRRDVGTDIAGNDDSQVTLIGGGTTGRSEVWQARIGAELAEQLRSDAEVLGLDGRTDIVKAALELLHRRAAQERMARSLDEYYGDSAPPLPLGVIPPDASS